MGQNSSQIVPAPSQSAASPELRHSEYKQKHEEDALQEDMLMYGSTAAMTTFLANIVLL